MLYFIFLIANCVNCVTIYPNINLRVKSESFITRSITKMSIDPGSIISNKIPVGSSWASNDILSKKIEAAAIMKNQNTILFYSDGELHSYNYIDSTISKVVDFLTTNNINYEVFDIQQFSLISVVEMVIPIFLTFYLINILLSVFGSQQSMMNKINKEYEIVKNVFTTFEDVAGLDDSKQELEEIVDYLKNPLKYVRSGAKIPKGVLLEGPPGTGKTLLARAVAGESGVSFISTSGSSFIEMFVGVGAARVRSLFEEAARNKPCVIFIDEIDAVGAKRGGVSNGGSEEREQTLNQLLTNMDGFEQDDSIIVLAATNRAEILDPALKRSGRFDRKISISLPDLNARKEILNVHTKNKNLSNVSLDKIAALTSGFSGADIEVLANEASLLSIRKNDSITNEIILKAFEKMKIGIEKKTDYRSDSVKKLVAAHEAGHALIVKRFSKYFDLQKITINSMNSGAGGYTLFITKEDYISYPTKGYFLAQILVALGGRAAEIVYYKNNMTEYPEINIYDDPYITVGASNDLLQANYMSRQYFQLFENIEESSDFSKNLLSRKINKLVNESLNKAISIIEADKHSFDNIIENLLKNNSINYYT